MARTARFMNSNRKGEYDSESAQNQRPCNGGGTVIVPICSGGVSPIAIRTEMRPSTAKYAAQASRLLPRSPSHQTQRQHGGPGPGPAHHEDAVEIGLDTGGAQLGHVATAANISPATL